MPPMPKSSSKGRWGRTFRNLLYWEFGIRFPLTAEDRFLCKEVYDQYQASPPKGDNWIASRYGADGYTFAKCIGKEGGMVRLCRFAEYQRCLTPKEFL